MHWYCVHPDLPLQAELRIRAAPNDRALEKGRIFQVYLDMASGKTEKGFVMAATPDGMPLVAPWETTSYCGCCQVMDPVTLMFDGSQDVARSLGAVQSVSFYYCMIEESKNRIRIFYPELESVWIDKRDLEVVCTRLGHGQCSTSHTFYEMNDDLPKEAQIAVREFPSKEAQVVGLLSRDETLEVTVRSGNWLQIVGGGYNEAWIMFQTDAYEFLQEAHDVCSSNCQRIQEDLDNIVDIESAANRKSTVNVNAESLPSNHVTSSTAGFRRAFKADQKLNADIEVNDVDKMENEHKPIAVNNFSGTLTVNVDKDKHLQVLDDCLLRSVQLVAVDNDSTNDIAAPRVDVGDAISIGSMVDTSAKVAGLAYAFQALDDLPISSAQMIHNEINADAVDDFANVLGCASRCHLDATSLENEEAGDILCTRSIQPARLIWYETEDDESFAVSDGNNVTNCKMEDVKETEKDEHAQTVFSQCGHTFVLPNSNNPVTKAVTNTVPTSAKVVVINACDSNDVEAVEDNFWLDDRQIRPEQKVAGNSRSGGIGASTVSKAWGADFGISLLSCDGSLRISAKSSGKFGGYGDATLVISAHDVVDEIDLQTTEPARNVKLLDVCSICPTYSSTDDVQVGDDDMSSCNGAVSVVTAVSCVEECVNGKVYGSCGDALIKSAQSQAGEVSNNEIITAYFDVGSPGSRSYVEGDADENLEVVHILQPASNQPVGLAPTDVNRPNASAGSPAVVAKMAAVDTVNMYRKGVDARVVNLKTEAVRSSQFTQPWHSRPVQSLPTFTNESDTSFNLGCNNLRILSVPVLPDAVDCNDDTCALYVNHDVEPSHSKDWQPIWSKHTMPDAPIDSTVTGKGFGIAVAKTEKHSNNDVEEKVVKAETNGLNSSSLNDCAILGGTTTDAGSTQLLMAFKSAGDTAIANETYVMNAGQNVTDDIDEAKQVQTAILQNYLFSLSDSDIVFSSAGSETMHDRHNPLSTAHVNTIERCLLGSESTSGSESGEIALLGDVEDVFEPVDEWLSTKQEKVNDEFRNDSLNALPKAMEGEPLSIRGTVLNQKQAEPLDKSTNLHSACHIAEKTIQIGVAVQPTGISFLEKVGIRKYYEHKQALFTSADMLSVAIYEANQDNIDLVFQALVGDEPYTDDWFHDVSWCHSHTYTYASSKDISLVRAGSPVTFDLIMNDASPEDILVAELSDDDDGDYALVVSFSYPVQRRKSIVQSSPPLPFDFMPSTFANYEAKWAGGMIEISGAPSRAWQPSQLNRRAFTKSFQEPVKTDIAPSNTALAKQCISQPKMLTPSSRCRRNAEVTLVSNRNPDRSFSRPRSLLQPLHGTKSVSSASVNSFGFAPPFEAIRSTSAETTTTSGLPLAQSCFQRQRCDSTSTSSKLFNVPVKSNGSTESPRVLKPSGLPALRQSFGFRYPQGLTKKT